MRPSSEGLDLHLVNRSTTRERTSSSYFSFSFTVLTSEMGGFVLSSVPEEVASFEGLVR